MYYLEGNINFKLITKREELAEFVQAALYDNPPPKRKDARILIKPNLNNDLNALTGNSTDLRLIHALLVELKARGYKDVLVADGSNYGVHRKGINVFQRLGLDRLCAHFGYRHLDLNNAEYREVELYPGVTTGIALVCLEADFIINLPTVKTHAEAGLSCCMKNLVGINVGQYKRKMHWDLPKAIFAINKIIKPNMHLVDGLVGMEGNGPGNGRPIRMDFLAYGDNAFLLDAVITRLIGYGSAGDIPYLNYAIREGILSAQTIDKIAQIKPLLHILKPDKRNFLIGLLGHNKLAPVRSLIRPLLDSTFARKLLMRCKLTQDIYEKDDPESFQMVYEPNNCLDCGICREYCPVEIAPPASETDVCLRCLNCYWVCAHKAINLTGELGYLKSHIERYKKLIEDNVGSKKSK